VQQTVLLGFSNGCRLDAFSVAQLSVKVLKADFVVQLLLEYSSQRLLGVSFLLHQDRSECVLILQSQHIKGSCNNDDNSVIKIQVCLINAYKINDS